MKKSNFFNDDRLPGFDDVSGEAAEQLAREWGYDECDESFGAIVGWAAGILHEDLDD